MGGGGMGDMDMEAMVSSRVLHSKLISQPEILILTYCILSLSFQMKNMGGAGGMPGMGGGDDFDSDDDDDDDLPDLEDAPEEKVD